MAHLFRRAVVGAKQTFAREALNARVPDISRAVLIDAQHVRTEAPKSGARSSGQLYSPFLVPKGVLANVLTWLRSETMNKQRLTKTILNRQSLEVWRERRQQREFRGSNGSGQCGGLLAECAVNWQFQRGQIPVEKVGHAGTGGARGIGIQHSPNLYPDRVPRGGVACGVVAGDLRRWPG